MIGIPHDAAMFEVMASIQIAQATGETGVWGQAEYCPVLEHAGILRGHLTAHETTTPAGMRRWELNYAGAYRAVDSGDVPYVDVLARESGFKALQTRPPQFPRLETSGRVLAVCTGSPRSDTRLHDVVWRELLKLLRAYDLPVVVVGERLGGCALQEDAFTFTAEERLLAVASAALVVGTPNEYMWAAAGMNKPSVLIYPDNVPARRWYHYEADNIGRVEYSPGKLLLPVLVAGVRIMIDRL